MFPLSFSSSLTKPLFCFVWKSCIFSKLWFPMFWKTWDLISPATALLFYLLWPPYQSSWYARQRFLLAFIKVIEQNLENSIVFGHCCTIFRGHILDLLSYCVSIVGKLISTRRTRRVAPHPNSTLICLFPIHQKFQLFIKDWLFFGILNCCSIFQKSRTS